MQLMNTREIILCIPILLFSMLSQNQSLAFDGVEDSVEIIRQSEQAEMLPGSSESSRQDSDNNETNGVDLGTCNHQSKV